MLTQTESEILNKRASIALKAIERIRDGIPTRLRKQLAVELDDLTNVAYRLQDYATHRKIIL